MNRKVLLIRTTNPDSYGGGETYQLLLAGQIKKHGLEPVIVTNSKGLLCAAKKARIKTIIPPYNKTQNWSGFRNLLLPQYFLWEKKLARYYKKLFQEEKPLAINVQSRDDWIAATPIAKKLGVRTLWTDHMDFRSWVLWNIDKKFKNIIGKKIIKIAPLADKIIFISDYEHKWFTSFQQTKTLSNLAIIKNGAIDQMNRYSTIKPAKNSFCYIGRIVDYKGIDELLTAFQKIAIKHPDAILNIYGAGNISDYQEQINTNSNIVYHGHTNRPLQAIAENETFILPSYIEGLSLSLLDAAMMRKTIIVTDVGAASEVVRNKKSGLLIPPMSAEALTRAMSLVLDNRALAKAMAKNARHRYEQEFNFEQIFEKEMLPLYQEREVNE